MSYQFKYIDIPNSTSTSPLRASPATAYSYFEASYYDSKISIWLSVDPLADDYPSFSPYNYCANNPVLFLDPDGRKIIVTRKPNEETGKVSVNISFTAELVNNSNVKLSKEKLADIKTSISNQITESFGRDHENMEVNVGVQIDPRSRFDDVTGEHGHVISIVNPDYEMFDDETIAGESERVSSEYGNMFISSRIIPNKRMLRRTAAHEFGHLSGLNHPDDVNATPAEREAGKNPNNVMHQTKNTSGADVEKSQIELIYKLNNQDE